MAGFALGLLVGWVIVQYGRGKGSTPEPRIDDPTLVTTPLSEVAHAVQKGGFIFYCRHANRDKWDSVIGFDVYEAATGVDSSVASHSKAVCLSAQGLEEAKMMGEIFRLGQVPVGTVVASPSCRAKQTALLAFGKIDLISNGLAHTPVTNESNAAAFGQEIEHLLKTVPIIPGTNTVIAAHGNTLENNRQLFASGSDTLGKALLETGCYVIRRESLPEGGQALHVVQRFTDVGVLAANTVNLNPKAVIEVAGRIPAIGGGR